MKTNLFKWFIQLFKLSTLKRRIIVSLVFEILLCFFLITIVSYNAIYRIQENNIKTAMLFDLDQQSNKLTENFTNLLLITQQMTPQGTIGGLVEDYNAAKEPYNRSVLSRNISSSIGQVVFSHSNIELVMYINPKDGRVIFNNLPPRDTFPLKSLPVLANFMDITYQPPHISLCRFSMDPVISVTRDITFSNGEQWVIYVEAKLDIATDMRMLSSSVDMPYVLTLLDKNNVIKYSSDSSALSVGKELPLSGNPELMNNYRWNELKSNYGYTVVLLVTRDSYNRELYAWRNYLLIILLAALPITALIAAMLIQLLYKPLRIFESEMEELGKGNMQSIEYKPGIEEFDQLFDQFNKMKQRIQQLILDMEAKERQKHQLEIEMISYQINPHFLMNTLNSVHWLALLHKQPEIDKVICTLNSLLSYNLGKSKERASLRSEIEVLSTYLELQQMRYDFKVNFNIEEGEYLDFPVAQFILQPIAENAVCHGLDVNGILDVSILPDKQNEVAHIIISDNGKGISEDILAQIQQNASPDKQQMGNGIGLRYVRFMLESFYGDEAKMLIESVPMKGTRITLCLPFRRGKTI